MERKNWRCVDADRSSSRTYRCVMGRIWTHPSAGMRDSCRPYDSSSGDPLFPPFCPHGDWWEGHRHPSTVA